MICYIVQMLWQTGVPKPGGMGGIYLPNNLTVSPQIVWVWSTSASPQIIWRWCASERRCPLEFEEKKSVPFLVKTFFLVFTWIWGKKCSSFGEDLFFWSSLNLLTWTKSWSSFILPNVKNRAKLGWNCKLSSTMLNKDRHPCWQAYKTFRVLFVNKCISKKKLK